MEEGMFINRRGCFEVGLLLLCVLDRNIIIEIENRIPPNKAIRSFF